MKNGTTLAWMCGAALSVALAGTPPEAGLWEVVSREAGFTAKDLAAGERGRGAARALESPSAVIAIAGIVKVKAPLDFVAGRLRDVEWYKKAPGVMEVGRFSDPPVMEDLARLRLDRSDVAAMKRCRVGACAIKLPAETIEKMGREIDWTRADARQQAEEFFRTELLEYVKRYLVGGNRELAVYGDKAQATSSLVRLEAILEGSKCLGEFEPALLDYLRDYGGGRMAGAEDFLYWSREKHGGKPVISVTHVTLCRPDLVRVAMASKQIYASHYFVGSLGLTMLETPPDKEEATRMAYVNRSWLDMLGGFFGGAARGEVSRRAVSAVQKNLERMRKRIEESWRKQESR